MAEAFLASVAVLAVPITCGLLLSFFMEHSLLPKPCPPWRRSPAAVALHVGLWLLIFTFELALFRRPWFAAAMVLFLMLPIILVSNAKYRALDEPFIFQDFEYFTDALKHPRLYLPFLSIRQVVFAAAAFLIFILAGLSLELPLTDSMTAGNFLAVVILLATVGALLIILGNQFSAKFSLEPKEDLALLGLLPCLWYYGWREQRQPLSLPASQFPAPRILNGERMPDLIAVQSESFFDIRRICASVRTDVLREYDMLRNAAAAHGMLKVPAWGANTVRTEFAFLSGIAQDELDIHRFNPYRKLAKRGIHTIASYLKLLGYRTICIHPYPASFYRRDMVFPLLGFDEFVDIRSFGEADKCGPYVGDMAVAGKVCSFLNCSSDQPVFVYVITMENHGPLHLEKIGKLESENLYMTPPPAGFDELTIYLRHLANADSMIGRLRAELAALPYRTGLCWFGDHVPVMPNVYTRIGKPDGRTNFVIWKNQGEGATKNLKDLEVNELATLFMKEFYLID